MSFWKEIIYWEFLYIAGFWFIWNILFSAGSYFFKQQKRRKQIQEEILSFQREQHTSKRAV